MQAMDYITLILNVLLFGALCFWIGLGVRLWQMQRTRPTIKEGLTLPNPSEALVSIIIPAHNEERVIDQCAASIRAQTHRNIQIVFVLDRCTDRTLEILQKHAEKDNRVCIVENDFCPDDWAGKCNAACVGATKATGDWILFTDADTEFDSELVRCAVASAIKRNASLLSLLSSLTITTQFERVVQPVASTFLMRQFPIERINRERKPRPFANGQFLLFSKKVYEEIGGHAAVHTELLEDIAFAKKIEHGGFGRVQVLFAGDMLRCSMYPDFSTFKEGWKRIYIEASSRNIKHLKRSGALAIITCVLLPLLALIGVFVGYQESELLLWVSSAMLMAYWFVIIWLYKINNAPLFFAVFAPVGALVVGKLFFDASSVLKHRTPISWGGRTYILEPRP
tara:strand:- start:733 stop:1917 length:1185 start_codon:yes stop_codon:yes gene_type:complete